MDCQIDADTLTIGRHPDNDVPLNSGSISSHHARIRRESDGFWLRDLGSTNGTRVNDQGTEEAKLDHGDKLRFGDIRAAFYEAEPDDIEDESGQLPVDVASRRAGPAADDPLHGLPQVETAAIHVKAGDGSVVTASSAQQQQRAAARGAARSGGAGSRSRLRRRGKGPVRPKKSSLASDRLGLVVFLFIVGVAFCTVLGLTVRHWKETGGFLPTDMFDKVRHIEVRRADGSDEPQQQRPIRGRQTVVPPADD